MAGKRTTMLVFELIEHKFITITSEGSGKEATRKLLKGETNHLPVIDAENHLCGTVTTYDITKAFTNDEQDKCISDIMTKKVITTSPTCRLMLQHVSSRKTTPFSVCCIPMH